MAANFSRVDVHFSKRNRERLNRMKQEAKIRTGRSVPMSRLIDEIVGAYFDREEINACIAPDNKQDSARESTQITDEDTNAPRRI